MPCDPHCPGVRPGLLPGAHRAAWQQHLHAGPGRPAAGGALRPRSCPFPRAGAGEHAPGSREPTRQELGLSPNSLYPSIEWEEFPSLPGSAQKAPIRLPPPLVPWSRLPCGALHAPPPTDRPEDGPCPGPALLPLPCSMCGVRGAGEGGGCPVHLRSFGVGTAFLSGAGTCSQGEPAALRRAPH